MSSVKKLNPISFAKIDKVKALSAMEIYSHMLAKKRGPIPLLEEERQQNERIIEFHKKYNHSYYKTITDIWIWYQYILGEKRDYSIEEIYFSYTECLSRIDNEPLKLTPVKKEENSDDLLFYGNLWVFKGFLYEVNGHYTDEETRLLILEDFDKERRHFEKLRTEFDRTESAEAAFERPRIPESVRVEVWRRDGGQCARCGSREKLEYDHIVPISKGGSNTARNIELLCEKHNRSKSNNIV